MLAGLDLESMHCNVLECSTWCSVVLLRVVLVILLCCTCLRVVADFVGVFFISLFLLSAIMRDLGVTTAVIISGEARLWVAVFLSLLTASLLCCYSCDTA